MFKRISAIVTVLIVCCFFLQAPAQNQVKLETTFGDIVLELDSTKAPVTVANFLSYVHKDFFADIIFHRVIKGFMIQGGGHTEDLTEKPTDPPIPNEAYNGLQNVRGAIAMARTSDPHSATAQFFINTVDNAFLNYKDSSSNSNWGYCAFGKVIEGMDIVDSIENVETETVGSYDDVPKTPIIITMATEITTVINTPAKNTPFSSVTFRNEGPLCVAVVQTEKHASFGLYDMKGKTVFSHKGLKRGRNVVPLENLASGVYVFGIKNGKKILNTGVFLKQ